jgi:hypothetical protein
MRKLSDKYKRFFKRGTFDPTPQPMRAQLYSYKINMGLGELYIDYKAIKKSQ